MIRWALAAYCWSVIFSLAAICCCCGPGIDEDAGIDDSEFDGSGFDDGELDGGGDAVDDTTSMFLFPGQAEQLARLLA